MAELEHVLRWAVDSEIGIIRQLMLQPAQPTELGSWVVGAQFEDVARLPPRSQFDRSRQVGLYGTSLEGTLRRALWAALGESFERYSASSFDASRFVRCAASSLPGPCVEPSDFILFSKQQYSQEGFPFVPPTAALELAWVLGINVTHDVETWVPANFVFLNGPPGARLAQQYSTGLACGQSADHALRSGLCEVIERDAFMFHWLARRPPPRLSFAKLAKLAPPGLARLVSTRCVDAFVFDLTTDLGVPVALTVLRDWERTAIAVGAAARPRAEEAISISLHEAFSTLTWVHKMLVTNVRAPAAEEVKTFEDHVAHYLDPMRQQALAFLLDQPESNHVMGSLEDSPELQQQVSALVKASSQAGFDVLCVDVTTDDLLALGLSAARVLVPGLHPLSCGPHAHEAPTRLRQLADHFCWQLPVPLNRDPHPFP
jgi:ribosomal protein S12 methylthiotransferase accessory factor